MSVVHGTTAVFSTLIIDSSFHLPHTIDHIVVIIDAQLYPWIQKKFHRYLSEVEERFPVRFSTVLVNGLRSLKPITPAEMRQILQKEYAINGTVGALLVGQVPYAIWEQGVGNNSGILSVFYEDMDGDFKDTDADGFYDYHIFGPHEGPEIWVCWMRPPIIGQVFFMNRFLEKIHRYYIGTSSTMKNAFVACHEDYDNNFYGPIGVVPVLQEIYGIPLVDTDGEGTDITVDGEIWRQLRSNRYEIFDTWQHANFRYQAWDSGGFSSLKILGLPNGALMTFLYGCHSADFWEAPGTTPLNVNIAVSYVFGRSIGQAASGTSWSYGTEYKYIIYETMRDHNAYLGTAWFAMEAYVETASFVQERYPDRDPHTECAGNTLIGNPFLYVNYEATERIR
ncbi:hypothetical protein AYK25_02225 [Thermoplasmatales archaeon SM1-50]|nr:MAG: hypothetical protein AYK25_02225 [Thermoplasmatales archaeon SM1-50]